jgi:cathepsin L
MLLVRFGPVAVGINTDGGFPFYEKGIYDSEQCSPDADLGDHAVLLVGYGTENGIDYWIVR